MKSGYPPPPSPLLYVRFSYGDLIILFCLPHIHHCFNLYLNFTKHQSPTYAQLSWNQHLHNKITQANFKIYSAIARFLNLNRNLAQNSNFVATCSFCCSVKFRLHLHHPMGRWANSLRTLLLPVVILAFNHLARFRKCLRVLKYFPVFFSAFQLSK